MHIPPALLERMVQLRDNVDLLSRWNQKGSRVDCALLNQKGYPMIKGDDHYDQFIDFKTRVTTKLAEVGDQVRFEFYRWLIKDWGGIKSFARGKSEEEKDIIFKGIEEEIASNVYCSTDSSISSRSKVMAYKAPERYVIYDSRVAAAYNWLLLTTAEDVLSVQFFPIPHGRSADFNEIDVETIINLYLRLKYSGKPFKSKTHYHDPAEAYRTFCETMTELANRLFTGVYDKPYLAEMVLYRYAKYALFNEIRAQIRICFHTQVV